MFKGKSKEIIKCTHCGEEIDTCDECGTWFEDNEDIFCDEIHSHFCKKCGVPKYRKFNTISANMTLDQFSKS